MKARKIGTLTIPPWFLATFFLIALAICVTGEEPSDTSTGNAPAVGMGPTGQAGEGETLTPLDPSTYSDDGVGDGLLPVDSVSSATLVASGTDLVPDPGRDDGLVCLMPATAAEKIISLGKDWDKLIKKLDLDAILELHKEADKVRVSVGVPEFDAEAVIEYLRQLLDNYEVAKTGSDSAALEAALDDIINARGGESGLAPEVLAKFRKEVEDFKARYPPGKAQEIVNAASDLVERYSESGSFPYADGTDGGRLGCANVVTTALQNAGVDIDIDLSVQSTRDKLNGLGWKEFQPPPFKKGDVVVWGVREGRNDQHIGIIMEDNDGSAAYCMSNSTYELRPTYHETDYMSDYYVVCVLRES